MERNTLRLVAVTSIFILLSATYPTQYFAKAQQLPVLKPVQELVLTPQSTQTFITNYTTANGQIYADRSSIVIHGVNWFGFDMPSHVVHGLGERNWRDMIVQMKSLGFNAVRLPVCPDSVMGAPVSGINYALNPDLIDKNSQVILDMIVWQLTAEHMYVVLDHHSSDCSSLPPLWYSSTYSQQGWINTLTTLALRYRNSNYFLGIDLENEPHGIATWGSNNVTTDWNTAAEAAGSAVLAVNPNILVFVEGVQYQKSCPSGSPSSWWGGDLSAISCKTLSTVAIPANKLILSPHVFGADVYNQPYFSVSTFPQNLNAIWEKDFGSLTSRGYTIVPGEWGGKYGTDNGNAKDIAIQNQLVSYFTQKNICNSFYWSWNADSTDTGGILQQDWKNPWSSKIILLQNYYSSCKN